MGRGGGHSFGGTSGGGRSFGGGHSFGGISGGGRSFGGISGSGRSSGRSGGSSSRSSGSSFRGSSGRTSYRAPSVFVMNNSRHTERGGSGSSGGSGGKSGGANKGGCLKICVVVAIIVFAYAFVRLAAGYMSASDIVRTPLEKGSVAVDIGYYHCDKGFYDNVPASEKPLTKGLAYFYEKTGVQPYIYFADGINGTYDPTNEDFDAYTKAKYSELFSEGGDKADGAHLLIVWSESADTDYRTWAYCGSEAQSVIDFDAMDMIWRHLVECYDNEDEYGSYGEFVGAAFEAAADEMMQTRSGNLMPVIVTGLIVAALVVCLILLVKKEKKIEEDLAAAAILSAPLEEYSDDAEKLAKKYGDAGGKQEDLTDQGDLMKSVEDTGAEKQGPQD